MLGSRVVCEELCERGDPRLVDELARLDDEADAAAVVTLLLADRRPFARATLLSVIDGPALDQPGHRALLRALLRAGEQRHDDELMAHLLVALDRSAAVIDAPGATRRSFLPGEPPGVDARRRRQVPFRARVGRGVGPQRVSVVSRRALRRRALRYFRALARTDAARYRAALGVALRLYDDAWLDRAPRILESWSLLTALFRFAPQLQHRSHRITVARGHRLGDVIAAPIHPPAGRGCLPELVALLGQAKARLVRRFARQWIEQEYPHFVQAPHASQLLPLLSCEADDVVAFVEGLLQRIAVDGLDVAGWRRLLAVARPGFAHALVEQARRYLDPSQLATDDLVALCRGPAAPIATQAAAWLVARADADALQRAIETPVEAARAALLPPLVRAIADRRDVAALRDLLDARFVDVRAAALSALLDVDAFADDPSLWSALFESPFADARAFLARHLHRRIAGLPAEALPRLFATSLLATLGGARTRARLLGHLAEQLVDDDDGAALERWGPLLSTLLGSVRATDRAAALASLVRAASTSDALRARLQRALPHVVIRADDDGVPLRPAARGGASGAARPGVHR